MYSLSEFLTLQVYSWLKSSFSACDVYKTIVLVWILSSERFILYIGVTFIGIYLIVNSNLDIRGLSDKCGM